MISQMMLLNWSSVLICHPVAWCWSSESGSSNSELVSGGEDADRKIAGEGAPQALTARPDSEAYRIG